jgi:hypothetical protein
VTICYNNIGPGSNQYTRQSVRVRSLPFRLDDPEPVPTEVRWWPVGPGLVGQNQPNLHKLLESGRLCGNTHIFSRICVAILTGFW